MKFRILMLSLLAATFVIVTQAQMGPGPGKHMSNYDPKSEVTMSGTVDRVTQVSGNRGACWPYGLHRQPAVFFCYGRRC